MSATTAKNVPCSNKQVLVINGSPHKDGPTAKLIVAFVEALPETADITVFDCFKRRPIPCDGCGYCGTKDNCVKRDLDDYYEALENADILVYALPIYNLSFPAPMKALIDRGQIYWSARFLRQVRPPIAKAKKVVLLTACGDSRMADGSVPDGGASVEKQLALPLTVLNGKLFCAVHYYGSDSGNPIEPYLQLARQAAVEVSE